MNAISIAWSMMVLAIIGMIYGLCTILPDRTAQHQSALYVIAASIALSFLSIIIYTGGRVLGSHHGDNRGHHGD
jgi:uncharacterized membrane protein